MAAFFLKKTSVAANNITLGVPGQRADKTRRFHEAVLRVIDSSIWVLLVLFVNDSEYKNFLGTQPIPGHCVIYLVSPGALLRLRAPTHLAPLLGERSTKKKSPAWSRSRRRCLGVVEALVARKARSSGRC
jgi:hypothetical protein